MNAQVERRPRLRGRRLILARLLFGLTCALTALDLIFLALNGSVSLPMTLRGAQAFSALAYAAIGQFLARKLPQNAIGWLFLLFGLIAGAVVFGAEYAAYVVLVHPGALPGGTLAAWLVSWIWISMIGISIYIFFLFPTGRLPSARWRPVAWATAGALALMILAQMFKPGPLRFALYLDNPIAVAGSDAVLSFISVVGYTAGALCLLAAAASVVVRLWRARGVERQQLKWFAYTAALLGVVGIMQSVPGAFNLAVPDWWSLFNFLLPVMIAALPFTVGVAILRYRLYEIDRVINHTLVYALLTLMLAAIYFGSVVLLQQFVRVLTGQQQSEIVTVISTLGIAALFVPLRNRIQQTIDKRFYRRKYNAQKVLAEFAQTARDEVDLHRLSERLLEVVDETMQPTQVSLWLKPTADRGRTTADGKGTMA